MSKWMWGQVGEGWESEQWETSLLQTVLRVCPQNQNHMLLTGQLGSWRSWSIPVIFKVTFISFKGRVRQKGRSVFYPLVHFSNGCNSWGQAMPEPGAPSEPLNTGGSGPSTGLSSVAFPGKITGSCVQSKAAGTWAGTHMWRKHHRWWLKSLYHSAGS